MPFFHVVGFMIVSFRSVHSVNSSVPAECRCAVPREAYFRVRPARYVRHDAGYFATSVPPPARV
jgi:hypothetical protein